MLDIRNIICIISELLSLLIRYFITFQLEFPAKPKGQIQKENDQKMAKFVKETNGKPETNNTVNNNDGKH